MPTQVELLKKYNVPIRGQMGQHLLIDPNIQKKIVDLLEITPGELILEIGPGLGALTGEALARGASVLAVEKDGRFLKILEEEWGREGKLEILHQDILEFDFSVLKKRLGKQKQIKVLSNLPYYITAPILFFLFENKKWISKAVLMMQKEVADRILAPAGGKEYGRLTLGVRYAAEVKHALSVPAGCFTPRPEVASTVLAMALRPETELLEAKTEKKVFALIDLAFSQRRKTLLSLLTHHPQMNIGREAWLKAFEACGFKPTARGEELLFKDFLALSEFLPDSAVSGGQGKKS